MPTLITLVDVLRIQFLPAFIFIVPDKMIESHLRIFSRAAMEYRHFIVERLLFSASLQQQYVMTGFRQARRQWPTTGP